MTDLEARNVRIGEVLLGQGFDSQRENHVRSGVKVIAILPQGLQVRRIHSSYLTYSNPQVGIEAWTIRWDQFASFSLLPEWTQLPLL